MKLSRVIVGLLICLMGTLSVYGKGEAEKANSDIRSVKSPGAYSITAFDRQGDRNIGGYFDTEYYMEKNANYFRAHRFILNASSRIHSNILVNSEIEYEYGGDGTNDGEIKIEQAWVDIRFSDAFTHRAGIVVIPFGIVNIQHDSDVRDSTERGLYAKYIVPTTWMDTGVGAHGVFDLGNMELNYEGYIVNGLKDAISSTKGIRNARPSFKTDNNKNKAVVGRVGVSPQLGIDLGFSYYTGKYNDANTAEISMFGLDARYKKGPFEVLSEWAQNSIQKSISEPEKMRGYYLEGRYHLTGPWLKNCIIGKSYKRPVITLFARYGVVDLDTDSDDKYDVTQTTLGFNYRPVETVAYKLEYEMNQEKASVIDNNKWIASVAVGF